MVKVSGKRCGRSALKSGIQVVPRYFIALRVFLRAFLFETEAIVWSILPGITAISSDPLQKRKLASNKKDWRIKNERIAENL